MNRYYILIFILLVFTFIFTGCNERKNAEASLNQMFYELKANDPTETKQYRPDGYEVPPYLGVMQKGQLDTLSYKIVSSEKTTDNKVLITTEVTAANMGLVMGEFTKQSLPFYYAHDEKKISSDQCDEEFIKIVQNIYAEKEKLPMVTTPVIFTVFKDENDVWQVEPNEELENAVTGGFKKYIEGYLQQQ